MTHKEISRRLSAAADVLEKLPAFDERTHDQQLNEIARDLNELVARAEYTAAVYTVASGDETDVRFCEAAIRIIQRVAEFEEVPTKQNQNTNT